MHWNLIIKIGGGHLDSLVGGQDLGISSIQQVNLLVSGGLKVTFGIVSSVIGGGVNFPCSLISPVSGFSNSPVFQSISKTFIFGLPSVFFTFSRCFGGCVNGGTLSVDPDCINDGVYALYFIDGTVGKVK